MSVENIKKSVDLADYVRSCGITLTKHGRNDLKGLCPFHNDKNPSLIISPAKGLFNCPVCGTGGSVIDFASKFHKITVSEAIKELSKNLRSPQKTAAKEKNNPVKKELRLERVNELLEKTVSFYEKTFSNATEGKQYLEKRGITDAGLFSKHRTGYADGSLLKALPSEGKILDELKQLGILLNDGFERFKDCVVFPVLDVEGNITTLYGRSIEGKKHVFLPGRPTGLFNIGIIKTYPEVILVESVLDALSLEMAGLNNVVSIQGTNGMSPRHLELMKEHDVEKVILLLDGDEPGRKASHELMGKLSSHFKVRFQPIADGHDPNSYLQEHGSEKLQNIFSSAEVPKVAAKEKNNISVDKCELVVENKIKNIENGFSITCGLRKYEILGLEKKQRSLKATIRVTKAGKIHVDTIDFYSSRMRKQLSQDICLAFEELPETAEADISKILKICEVRTSEDTKSSSAKATADMEKTLTPQEQKEAEEFGRSPDLIERILSDFEKCGLVGERNNKLLCYLAMTSRKMKEPLSVLILSSSGAGKTALQDTALNFCPPEDLVKLTSLSAKALFYKEKTSLKHKVLAIEEGAGAEEASYAIRNLISSDGLTSEVAIRDPQTGKLTTMANTVDGPTAVFVTNTDPEVDPETRSRFLVTGIDESREQTRKILEFQRQSHGLEGLGDNLEIEKIRSIHRNFQRLLKPVKVINPLVNSLFYGDDRLQARRTQPQYLNIIASMAFLRQMCKEVKVREVNGKKVEFLEVEIDDVTLANSLAVEILGRSLDELSIPSRNLLELIEKMLDGRIEVLKKTDREKLWRQNDLSFTRRDIRESAGWTNTRVHTHLKELMEMEYIVLENGRGTSLQHYKLVYDGQGKDGRKFIPGVKDVAEILGLKKVQ